LAVGGSTLLNDGHTPLKASLSIDTQSRATAGAGLGWRF
jgi:hypothetical protein